MIRHVMVAAITICCGEATAAITLYSQAPNFLAFGGATSVVPLPITADDFRPADAWKVSAATLQGAWRNGDETIAPGTTTRDSRIRFYEDVGGLPSDPPVEDFSVLATLSNPQSHPDGFTAYDIAMIFPTSLSFAPGVNYWFAAIDEGPGRSGSDGFFWSSSADGDADLAQKGDTGWQLFQENLGYSLIGTIVPEPSGSFLALMAGLLSFAWRQPFGLR